MKRIDVVFAAALFVLAAWITHRAAVWDSDLYERSQAFDVWFDADVNAVYNLETSRWEHNDRRSFHPLWAYVSFPPVWVLTRAGIENREAVRIFHSAIAGLWAAGFFLLLRRIGLRRPDSLIFTALAGTTATAFFWLPATETFAAGAVSLFPALWIAGTNPGRTARSYLWAQVSAIGVTVTNWMAGLFISLIDLRLRTVVWVSAAALGIAAAGQQLQTVIYPSTIGVVKGAGIAPWIYPLTMGGPLAAMRVFFFSAVTSPEIGFSSNYRNAAWPLLSIQHGGLFTGGAASWIATPAWAALLGFALWALLRLEEHARLRKLIALTVLYQLWMHLLYGRETFLYAFHFVPLLVLAAALAARTRWRPVVLALALIAASANAVNNRAQFLWARDYSARSPKLVRVEGETLAQVRKPRLQQDPAILYRFWRDGK